MLATPALSNQAWSALADGADWAADGLGRPIIFSETEDGVEVLVHQRSGGLILLPDPRDFDHHIAVRFGHLEPIHLCNKLPRERRKNVLLRSLCAKDGFVIQAFNKVLAPTRHQRHCSGRLKSIALSSS